MSITINGNGTISGYTPSTISGTLSGSNMPTGAVIQAKFAKDTSYQNVTNNGLGNTASNWFDLPNLSINITPTSSSNKILVLAHACGSEQTHAYGLWFRVMRGTVALGGDVSASGYTDRVSVGFGMGCDNTYMDDQMGSASFSYMDEPAVNTQLTYKVQGIARSGSFYINRTVYNTDNTASGRGASSITLMEIKG